jgi:hypothetical protein
MKRTLLTLTVLFSLISFSSFANDDVAPVVLKSFNASFKAAKEVNWTISSGLYKANFNMDGQHVTAFYETGGKMVAMTRNITSFQLPMTLQASLKSESEGYWISDLFEISNDEGTSYFVTLETADTKLVLKANGTDTWGFYQKTRKH